MPISQLSRLEILLKNSHGQFDPVWEVTIGFNKEYQMYLCSGLLTVKYYNVELLPLPIIWVYFQRVCMYCNTL